MPNNSLHVLLVEDNPGDARLIREMLRDNTDVKFTIQWAERLTDGLDSLRGNPIDIILLDLMLPDSQGIDTFLAMQTESHRIPTIILTGLDDEELAVEALRHGAQDYLPKGDLESNLLRRSIRYAIERNQSELALRESEEFNASLLDNSPNPIIVINPDTSIYYINQALEKITGFTSSELIGKKTPYPWWCAEKQRNVAEDFRKAMQDGAERLEELFRKKNGEKFWVEITSRLVTLDGRFKYYLANWVDITDIKQAEEELRRHRDQLEELVLERTAELTRSNKKLRQEIMEHERTAAVLKKREQELDIKSHYLEDATTALKVLLKHREDDKDELQGNVVSNVKELVMPYIGKLRTVRSTTQQQAYLDVIENNLNNIISPFLRNVTLNHYNLTPREIEVANLVKNGKTTKDIGDILNLSTRAVEFHRDNIRKKMGLKKTKTNLRSILLSLQ
ncbi:MAG: PAS domain S-box protein [Deltaproteobacteria bacterium]|nr:PAS domain S-box protein [Deltaproteobacteria bacterium]